MIIDVLKEQVPFMLALLICVLAHTIMGAVKHTKLSDFDWKALLIGALKLSGVLFSILCLFVALNLYEPLAVKFEAELVALEELIVIGVFAKVLVLIKDYFEIKDEDIEVVDYSVDKG